MLISYKYKFYHSKKNKALEYMMSEAAFVWNHALALQKRYYSIAKQFGWETKYIPYVRMAHHFAKRIKRTRLSSATVQELLMRQDKSFLLFFKHMAQRPPKFRKSDDFSSFVFKQSGYKLYGNELLITKTSKRFKFSLSRPYDGQVKIVWFTGLDVVVFESGCANLFLLLLLRQDLCGSIPRRVCYMDW